MDSERFRPGGGIETGEIWAVTMGDINVSDERTVQMDDAWSRYRGIRRLVNRRMGGSKTSKT